MALSTETASDSSEGEKTEEKTEPPEVGTVEKPDAIAVPENTGDAEAPQNEESRVSRQG